ncbi:unnamed protein product, partial [Ectocarpus fasciculatus]
RQRLGCSNTEEPQARGPTCRCVLVCNNSSCKNTRTLLHQCVLGGTPPSPKERDKYDREHHTAFRWFVYLDSSSGSSRGRSEHGQLRTPSFRPQPDINEKITSRVKVPSAKNSNTSAPTNTSTM